jgi:hypothetical protein
MRRLREQAALRNRWAPTSARLMPAKAISSGSARMPGTAGEELSGPLAATIRDVWCLCANLRQVPAAKIRRHLAVYTTQGSAVSLRQLGDNKPLVRGLKAANGRDAVVHEVRCVLSQLSPFAFTLN